MSPAASLARDFSLLWRAALATRHPRTNLVVCCGAVLLALFVGTLAWFKTTDPLQVAVNSVRAAFAILAFGWMMYFVPGAIKLNTPANATLVPRMRRRARQLTVLVWLAATGLATLLALGSALGAHLVFLGVGFWLIALGLARAGHRAGMLVQFLVPMGIMFHAAIPREWLAQLATWPALAVASLLMLALGAWTLDMMFPQGGDRHFRLQAAQKLVSDQTSVEGMARRPAHSRLNLGVYRAALGRDCARRDAGALLMHVLGPAVHWSLRLLPLVSLLAIVALALLVVRRVASAGTMEAIAGGSWFFASSALFVQLFDYERRLLRLDFTRGEQGLVRLAPAMPAAAPAFNRRLARRLLRSGLTEWAILSAFVLCVVALTGAPVAILSMQACICCLTLPLLASNLRDHAHRSGSSGWRMFLGWLLALGAAFLAAGFAQRAFGTPLLPGAAFAAAVIAAAAVAWRWRRLVAAPHAFPVGRLA